MSETQPAALPSPAPAASEHRGWSLKMFLWSAALAAFLLAGAWGAANWKVFHLAYYKHCARKDSHDIIAFEELVRVHLRKGMTKEETQKLLGNFRYIDKGDRAEVVATYGYVVELLFQDGRLEEWRTGG